MYKRASMLDLVQSEKTAGIIDDVVERVRDQKVRRALVRAATRGAGAGVLIGSLQHSDPDESRLKKIVGMALLGGAGGLAARGGLLFPRPAPILVVRKQRPQVAIVKSAQAGAGRVTEALANIIRATHS